MSEGRKLIPDTTPEADLVMTPKYLAKEVVSHFRERISGSILEPCMGSGVFLRELRKLDNVTLDWCELSKGKDFFNYTKKVDWIITNPPWSKTRAFLKHSYEIADNIIYLITVNHMLTLKARLRDMTEAGFHIEEVLLLDTPKENWPQSGFQLGAVYLKRGPQEGITWVTK